ncbi:MAG: discoidin domain-containing protein [Marinilabiliaceae bacterium]
MKRKFTGFLLAGALCMAGAQAYAQETTPEFDAQANLALNKEATSSNGTASDGNDGNLGTRWRSTQGVADEWWSVDLGDAYVVNRVVVRMAGDAGARGATYDIEVSLNGIDWDKVVDNAVIPTGGENEFNDHEFALKPARYVRYKGLASGGWDHNFAEFEVYGVGTYDPDGSDELSNVIVTPATSINYAGDKLALNAFATSGKGIGISGTSFIWSVEPAEGAAVDANGVFTATATGSYTVTATATIGGTTKEGKATVEVREARKAASISVDRVMENATTSNWSDIFLTGEAVKFSLEAYDQYDGLIDNPAVTYDLDGGTLDEAAKTVKWDEAGTKTLKATAGEVSASFTVEVIDAKQVVGGMTATASSENADANMTADKAIDNDLGSRWASEGTETGVAKEESLIVDLGESMNLVAIGVTWEGACAAEYTIEVSADGESYTSLGGETRELGIVNHLYRVKGDEEEAVRYIKVACAVPATNYGYSIFEVTPYIANEKKPVTPPTSVDLVNDAARGIVAGDNGAVRFTEEMRSVRIYSAAGNLVKSAQNATEVNVGATAKGIYIVKAVDNAGRAFTAKFNIR